MFRTRNPALRRRAFNRTWPATDRVMAIGGVVRKSALLAGIVILTAFVVWKNVYPRTAYPAMKTVTIVCAVAAFITAFITVRRKTLAPITSPVYAVLKGLCIGFISARYGDRTHGIVLHAVLLTLSVFVSILAIHATGRFRPGRKFKDGVIAASAAVALVYFISFILYVFGQPIPLIHQSGTVGILFSLAVVTLAALNLVLDFDTIESGARNRAPVFMEWYSAFGLLVTLVWLYIGSLRLISKILRFSRNG